MDITSLKLVPYGSHEIGTAIGKSDLDLSLEGVVEVTSKFDGKILYLKNSNRLVKIEPNSNDIFLHTTQKDGVHTM